MLQWLQWSNTRLAFAALPGMLPVGRLGKAPRCGHSWAPAENESQRDALVTALRAFQKSLLSKSIGCIQREVWGDSESSDSVIVWVGAGVLCPAQRYHSTCSLSLNFSCSQQIQGRRAWARAKACLDPALLLYRCKWQSSSLRQWIKPVQSQQGSLFFVGKAVAVQLFSL